MFYGDRTPFMAVERGGTDHVLRMRLRRSQKVWAALRRMRSAVDRLWRMGRAAPGLGCPAPPPHPHPPGRPVSSNEAVHLSQTIQRRVSYVPSNRGGSFIPNYTKACQIRLLQSGGSFIPNFIRRASYDSSNEVVHLSQTI